MNKDERIKQILNDMSDYCYCEIYHDCPFESREAHECNRCKAEALYNAGYRKIADDEIVIKKDYLKEELQWLERNARQEQTRKILQELKKMFGKSRVFYWSDTGTAWDSGNIGEQISDRIEQYAKEKGIELE